MLGELVDRSNVGGVAREADNVPPAGGSAESRLQSRHRRERLEHLARRIRTSSARTDLSQSALVDGAVLADFELGQVKAKCLGLPDQVLQLAERESRGATRGER